jgi:hypothetical protein
MGVSVKHGDTTLLSSGWWYTYPSEKYEFVSWDDDIPNIWKNKKCSKPPTSGKFTVSVSIDDSPMEN